MHLRLLLLLLFTASIQALSQQWTGPVRITGPSTLNGYPDIAVDKEGNIHCVWAQRFNNNFWKIYTAISNDYGDTWKNYTDVSHNSSLWMYEPHIAIDGSDHIHITYDYNAGNYLMSSIYYTTFDGTEWSQPQCLSDSWPGSYHNRLVVDTTGRVVCFWYYGTVCYREKLNGQWGSVVQPFSSTNDQYFLADAVVNSNNTICCFGIHIPFGMPSNKGKLVYWTLINNTPISALEISDTIGLIENGLAFTNNAFPVFAWAEARRDTDQFVPATYYRSISNTGLGEKQLISNKLSSTPAVGVGINNKMYFVQSEKVSASKYELVCYKIDDSEYQRTVLSSNTFEYYNCQLIQKDPYLYLVTTCRSGGIAAGEIQFYKLNTSTGIQTEDRNYQIMIIPNPAYDRFSVCAIPASDKIKTLRLFDNYLIERTAFLGYEKPFVEDPQGSIRINLTVKGLPPGIYYLMIQTHTTEIITKVVLINH